MQTLRKIRPWIQLTAFLCFAGLLVWAGRTRLPEDLFFLADPLVGLAHGLAAHRITSALLVGGVAALVAAVALGRAWCGWLCPLGTLLDWMPARRVKRFAPDPLPLLRAVKYFILALILVAALLGNLTFLILDPITLTYRTATTAIWPALNALINGAEVVLYRLPFLRGAIDAFETGLRGVILPLEQPRYPLGVLIALLFAGVLALNMVRERFWCRYLCPLGGLLGLISKVAWLRRDVGDACTECQRCARACPTGAIDPARGFESDPSECTLCLACVPVCARGEQHFKGHLKPAAWREYDPSRRQFVAAAGAALTAVGLFAAEPTAGRDDPRLIRPPGAQGAGFLSQCIRCGICLKVCPTSGLQPSLAQASWAGLWTPVLASRLGHCDYSCTACGEACPVGAIPRLDLETKRLTVIGHAYIDRDRCIPWTDDRICLVCEEMCPLPEKAIVLEEVTVQAAGGGAGGAEVLIRRPHVLRDRCIGCGICENRCPLNGDAAIRVYAPTALIGNPSGFVARTAPPC